MHFSHIIFLNWNLKSHLKLQMLFHVWGDVILIRTILCYLKPMPPHDHFAILVMYIRNGLSSSASVCEYTKSFNTHIKVPGTSLISTQPQSVYYKWFQNSYVLYTEAHKSNYREKSHFC